MSISPLFPFSQISPWPCLLWSTGLTQSSPQLLLNLISCALNSQSLCAPEWPPHSSPPAPYCHPLQRLGTLFLHYPPQPQDQFTHTLLTHLQLPFRSQLSGHFLMEALLDLHKALPLYALMALGPFFHSSSYCCSHVLT